MVKKSTKKVAKSRRGARYECTVCGLAVTVDNICGCVDTCDIICCGKAMKPKKMESLQAKARGSPRRNT